MASDPLAALDSDFINRLKQLPLFARCGEPLARPLPFRYALLSDPLGVNQALGSANWESFTLEAQNRLTVFLHLRHSRQYQCWNTLTEAYQQELLFLPPLARRFATDKGLDALLFEQDCQWIFLGLCMENHYLRLNARLPVSFRPLLPLYEAGHIPCGWQGEVPEDHAGRSMDLSAGTLPVY